MDLASKKLNWQPCYKPPAHLTCRTALAFDCLYPVQPNRLRCRETRNKSITAEKNYLLTCTAQNALRFPHNKLKTKGL